MAEHYYPPDPAALDFSFSDGYTPPVWNAAEVAFDYAPPDAGAINFAFEDGYTPPQWDDVRFGGVSSLPEIGIALAVTEPAETVLFQITADAPATASMAVSEPAEAVSLQLTFIVPIDATININQAETVSFSAAWGDPVPTAALSADIKTLPWSKATQPEAELNASFTASDKIDTMTGSAWAEGEHRDAGTAVPINMMPVVEREQGQPWGDFDTWADSDTELPENYPLPTDINKGLPWADFEDHIDRYQLPAWLIPPAVDRGSHYRWFSTALFFDPEVVADEGGEDITYTPPLWNAVNFTPAGYPNYIPPDAGAINFGEIVEVVEPERTVGIRPADPGVAIPHEISPTADTSRTVPWGAGSWTRPLPDYIAEPGWNAEPGETADRPVQPTIREVYIFMPSITLYRTPDGTEIEATNVTWSTDTDSWGWRFNATLADPSQKALLKADSNGPREIACEINGHTFTGMVRGCAPTRDFANGETVTIRGVSLSGWLSDPHAPARSKLITAPYTASQLAELELQNTGWTLDWQAQDWLIPAGAYSYETLTPIGAIKRLAESIGAFVMSDPASKTLIVKSRHPVSPHLWSNAGTQLDAILPADLVQQISSDNTSRPAYNRAIVAGGINGGVIVTVTRDGTAGDVLAPQITDNLITHQNAGYERGRVEIGKGGVWETMNLTTWLTQQGEAPGLILPGYLVELQDTAETYPVQITGTSISAQSSEDELIVRQTLTAERSVTNA
ncbi:hypothetical protein [Marinobacterium lutimaris]|uniref:Phage tail protein n=1 Tax=Marinobacterium lutimaris TaxID=568106 RepID=A0A1H5XJH4_9GAMM|nr:hypothetical protein [Marinobacterium lutimaris]SEG11908.1 hypothetical protein SAMN05444390_1011410 [Marinobacterium lutimaris]